MSIAFREFPANMQDLTSEYNGSSVSGASWLILLVLLKSMSVTTFSKFLSRLLIEFRVHGANLKFGVVVDEDIDSQLIFGKVQTIVQLHSRYTSLKFQLSMMLQYDLITTS